MRGIGWLAGASLALAAGTMEGGPAERLRASYGSISGSTVPIWITKDAGLFEKHGLDVELPFIEGGAKAMAALVAGDVPIAQLGGSHVVSSHVAGSGVVILAGVVNRLEYKVVVAKHITRPEQLRGKRAAVATLGFWLGLHGWTGGANSSLARSRASSTFSGNATASSVSGASLSEPFASLLKRSGSQAGPRKPGSRPSWT